MGIFTKGVAFLALPLLVVSLANAAQSGAGDKGSPERGAKLYSACAPCHTMKGNGIAGNPEAELLEKMQGYRSGVFSEGKIKRMQEALQGLNEQELLDVAAYISTM